MKTLRLTALAIALSTLAACQTAPQQTVATNISGLRTTTVDYISGNASGGDLPPAKVGECYARVITPAVIQDKTERVLKSAAYTKLDVVPANYAEAEERVLVKAASKKLEIIPAVYETVEEKVLVKPAGKRLEVVPATYKTVTERKLVREAYTVWKRSSELTAAERALQGIDAAAGDVLCLIEVPAEYTTVSSQVVDVAAGTREVDVPAEYTTVKRTVMKTAATTREVEIPAEYAMVKTTKLVSPAREVKVEVPAEYDTVTQKIMVSPAKSEWRQVLCQTNATSERLSDIQKALTKAGYATGRTDGVIDDATLAAVRKYQAAKGLPVDSDRYVNVATVRSLGLAEK